ncbi:hypothetical protein [Micromonospora sp. NPDC005172]|uniref:hypothetical protein n=1 Tax=Micromonospora sp. NPDC005172 TaxID=3156867 RepID=UPI0033B4CC59
MPRVPRRVDRARQGASVAVDGAHRHIDYVYFWKRLPAYQLLWMTGYDIVGGTASDHNGVVATFTIQS